jgi:CheY-like chemotaxis protein
MQYNLFSGAEILIAEDDIDNYILLEELMHPLGASPFWAKNGIEVLEILAKQKNISLILMDVNMPKMDGITATQKIREKKINIPIIFQTAYISEEKKKEGFTAGGNEFLGKPLNNEILCYIFNKYL